MADVRKTDFSKGTVLENIVRMSVPMTLALLVNVLYSLVDRIYIGHIPDVGSLALTGIGLAFPITMIITAFQRLCSTGGAPLFSMARGRGDVDEAAKIQGNAFLVLILFGALLTAIGLFVKEPVLRATGASDATFPYADDYITIYLYGTVFVMISLGMNPFINAQGFPKVGMLTVILGAVVNIVLDPLFIYVFDMGVKGAAIATVIAQGCSAGWVVLFLLGKKALIPLRVRDMVLSAKRVLKMFSLGITGFTFSLTSSAVGMIYNAELLVLGGDMWVSAMTIVNSIREFVFMPVQGATDGTQPVMGYNYGAKEYGRVRGAIKIVTAICVAYMLLAWAVMMGFPGVFVRMFTDDAALLPVASEGIRLYFCLSFFMAFQMVGQTTFVALGKSRFALTFSLLRKVVLVIPLALILPNLFGLGVRGVFLSEPVSDIIGGAACFITMYLTVYRRLKREENA